MLIQMYPQGLVTIYLSFMIFTNHILQLINYIEKYIHFVQDAFQCFLNWLFQLFCLNTGTLCWQKTLNWCVQNCISSFCLSLNSCVPTDSCFIIFLYHSYVVFDKISGIWKKIMKQAPVILHQCSYFKL